jgi:hypothetical protein
MGFLKYTLVFLLGFVACAFLVFAVNMVDYRGSIVTGFSIFDAAAPLDRVSSEDIIVFDDSVLIRVENATLSSYSPGESMLPLIDVGANGIRIVPKNSDDVDVGDIVSFRKGETLVVHRVIEKGFDNEGLYFITQGDSASFSDGKVRFSDIEHVTIGVIW